MIKGSFDYGQKPINVSYHSAKFDGHGHCGSGDIMILICQIISQEHVVKEIMILICQMISQDHVIKGSCDFRVRAH